jgi:hypothetical protein
MNLVEQVGFSRLVAVAFFAIGCTSHSLDDDHVGATACDPQACLSKLPAPQRHPCIKAVCLEARDGSGPECVYSATLIKACRCHPGDTRVCQKADESGAGSMQCEIKGARETAWSQCG